VFATLVCCLASGITAGFAALKPVLVSEGVYQELCSADNVANSVISPTNFTSGASKIPCAKQDLRLNLFFILTSIMSNVSTLFAGAMLDRFGRHTCYIASSVFLAIGCILMGSAFAIPSFDGFIPANLFLGLGGTFLFVSSFQLANAFPKCPGTVVALITGAFDASAAVFLFYRTAYEASRRSFSPAQFFFGYLTVPALILIAELTFMPVQAYHSVRELEQKIERANDGTLDVHDSDESISDDRELRRVRAIRTERRITLLAQMEGVFGNTAERQERAIVAAEHHAASGVWGALHGVPFRKQIISPWFILLLLLTILQMLRMNYFIATIRAQYRYMLNSEDEARGINHFFDAALPTAGIVLSPFLGLLLDNVSVATMFAVVTVFIIIIGILNSLPLLWAGYATVVAFVVFRPLYYSVMS
jgi:MFS family permease